ncbi:S-layer homology domain-containing protein [Truepera radiovictrix]|uniref:S-layer domain protein n=1 Tax=Truepera radiovictrix (strain DSM 17093 / CIP 108686 / LMG 22925 / RQ-24) TaxID=649638 RepID=D7CWT9_TRURR|nr:S-layer homology domain-containing protein [Truepera radiovictrix]ADI13180.1 S-layer domain protein [Truepera radiovictrix DSM 17093]WMT58251.1 S-layer homology domain-containing protein [Truepera radiovictrix]
MKKLLLATLALLIVSGAAAQSFPDVPEGSYAEEAVARLADLGIIIGFPDGTFRGNEPFNRYQAALVVSRLLDLIDSEFLSAEDLDTVRNALQELASDVAANEEAIAALEEALAGAAGADADAVAQLQTQLDALRVELDTAIAASQGLAALEQQVASNTSQIQQLTDLVTILNEDIAALATGGEVDPGFLEQIEQNTGDIANLREFVVLLRRDQVATTERVAALEASDAEQSARLDDLETRVTELEATAVAFSGSIGLEYDVRRLSGAEIPFDTDRIFGVGLEREEAPSFFTTGAADLNDDGDQTDMGERAEDRQDIFQQRGRFRPVLELNVDFSAERGLAPASGLNQFESTVALRLREARVLQSGADITDPTFDFTNPDNYFTGYVFEFTGITATLGPIGADPINFFFGQEPGADFSAYVFESLGPGFRVEIGSPDFLAFLQPTLELAYGVYEQGGDAQNDPVELPDHRAPQLSLGGAPQPNPWTDAYYRGVRGTLTPFSGPDFSMTGGFSVGQIAGNAGDNADAANDNIEVTAWSLDGQVNLSVFNLEFEYAANDIPQGALFQQGNQVLRDEEGNLVDFEGNPLEEGAAGIPVVQEIDSTSLVYAELTVDTEAAGLPLLRSLSANYRSIPQFWYGLKYDTDTFPWSLDQVGYGAEATVGLSIFNLTGFVDTYTITNPATETGVDGAPVTGTEVFAYGARLGVEVFRAIEVYGFYNVVTLDGQQVEALDPARRNEAYVAGVGLGVEHDGAAANALVPGLNFNVAYDLLSGSIAAATVDTEVTVGPFALSPYVGFDRSFSAGQFTDDTIELRAGTGLATEPLDLPLAPSFLANVNFRNTDHFDVAADVDDYTATVLQYSVGIQFTEFLLPESSLGVRYGSFTGENIVVEPNTIGSGDFASDISGGGNAARRDVPGTGTQSTEGYEVVWNYYGLELAYGAYTNTNPPASPNPGLTGGQAFAIRYTVEF